MMVSHYQKGGAVKWIVVIVALLIAGFVVFTILRSTKPIDTPVDEIKDSKTGTITYRIPNSDLRIEYPSVLTLKSTTDGFSLTHSVPYKHADFCNLKDSSTLSDLSDFNFAAQIVNENINAVIREKTLAVVSYDEKGNPIASNNPNDADSGQLAKITAGQLSGYAFSMGVEGCGAKFYFLKISDKQTLLVTKEFRGEFAEINSNHSEVYALPGVILPDKQQQYMKSILDSITLTAAK